MGFAGRHEAVKSAHCVIMNSTTASDGGADADKASHGLHEAGIVGFDRDADQWLNAGGAHQPTTTGQFGFGALACGDRIRGWPPLTGMLTVRCGRGW